VIRNRTALSGDRSLFAAITLALLLCLSKSASALTNMGVALHGSLQAYLNPTSRQPFRKPGSCAYY
jgi:hypothetical protein